jgi:hypothetical protein
MRTTSASTGARVVALNLAENAYKDLVVDGANVQIATGGNERVRIDASGICVTGNVKFGLSTNTNTFLGYNSGYSNTTGCCNTFVGFCAGYSNTTGRCNTFVGFCAGSTNSTGNFNTFLGNASGLCNTTGNNNTFVGINSGISNSTGSHNTFLGRYSGSNTTTGCCNVFIGAAAGALNTSGCNNTFLGTGAGYNNTANLNTFVGYNAGCNNTTGCCNVFIGGTSGRCNINGSFNLALGHNAGADNISGSCNVFLGYAAGGLVNTSNNILIGYDGGSGLGSTLSSNRIAIGNANHTVACIQIAWTTASDVRDKIIFGPVPFGKSFLRQINPITYSFKNRETNEITDDRKRFGFCAQEVSSLEGGEDIIVNTDDPNKLGMSHEYLIPVLVNAIKELADELDDLRAEIQQLKSA